VSVVLFRTQLADTHRAWASSVATAEPPIMYTVQASL
jgi:hypothetical protein